MSTAVPEDWLAQHAYSMLYFLIWASLAFVVAWRKGFFQLPPTSTATSPLLSCWHVIGAFFFYLLASIIIAPLIYRLLATLFLDPAALATLYDKEDPRLLGWLYVFTILFAGITLFLYLIFIGKRRRAGIFFPDGNESKMMPASFYKPFFKGAAAWLLCYPIAGAIGQGIAMIVYFIFHYAEAEQSVIHYLKQIQSFPLLFSCMVFCIVAIVPIIEETVFRGFLQTWLKGCLGRSGAIILTAFLFSIFHYTPLQGMGNIEIIFSLFVLALFLGFLYERMRSLWASIGLHCTFNAVSIALLIFFPSAA